MIDDDALITKLCSCCGDSQIDCVCICLDLPPRYVPRQAESLTFCGLSASSAWFECLAA